MSFQILFAFSQIDYVCFDFVPRHHNVIRYRIGVATIKENFHTVCSYVRFPSDIQWKYDLLLGEFKVVRFSKVPTHTETE